MPDIAASRYEFLYIIPASLTESEVAAAEAKVSSLLEKHGAKTESVSRLGKLRLAYPIKKQRHGNFVLAYFTAERPQIAKLEEALRITPEVLRHLIIRAEEGMPKFDLVPFQEVNVEARDERPRPPADRLGRRKVESREGALIESKEEVKTLTAEEIDKKIESALSDDQKGV